MEFVTWDVVLIAARGGMLKGNSTYSICGIGNFGVALMVFEGEHLKINSKDILGIGNVGA